MRRPLLTISQILDWADAFRERHGRWPQTTDGWVGLPDCTWRAVDTALHQGKRGLPGGTTLARLLLERRGRRHRRYPPALTPAQVHAWADAHYRRTGEWPTVASGRIPDAPGETWAAVNNALVTGIRGFPGGSSLAHLLDPGTRRHAPQLVPGQVLGWADTHHARTGRWPTRTSGPIADAPGETWQAVDAALLVGRRGLPGGSSLARLLANHRAVRNRAALRPLTAEQVLVWADVHHARTGHWPTPTSGPIADAPGETWAGVNRAFAGGGRGMAGGSSLARLLAENRGVRNLAALRPLTAEQVLVWADVHHARTGHWPTRTSGPIADAPGETWAVVDSALLNGSRGFPGKDSLARFLARHRGVRNRKALPPLVPEQVLAWADAHHARTGAWPTHTSGPIPDAPGETWERADAALRCGHRGLPGGSSLAQLLDATRGVRNHMALLPLTAEQFLAWADAHHVRTGRWPTQAAGPIPDAPGETWQAVDAALLVGSRGLPGGSSLARLLANHRAARNHMALPPLTAEQVLAWADAHHARTGRWPTQAAGPIPDAPGEKWSAVDSALLGGSRGLPGKDTLARFLARHRGVRHPGALPDLTLEQIRAWARAHNQRTGRWPRYTSGPIPEAPGETWSTVEKALNRGRRGLPAGLSVHRVVREYQTETGSAAPDRARPS
ncbi:MAG: hypothetical protein JWO38_1557 [Gemmataceae bacterium]|nr:hypothetical protein [Gemmataceae bacterium]